MNGLKTRACAGVVISMLLPACDSVLGLGSLKGPPDGAAEIADTGAGSGCGHLFTILDPGDTSDTAASCVGGSGQVRDNSTGLVWARNEFVGDGGVTQAAAVAHCVALGGRLPTEAEAKSITALSCCSIVFGQPADYQCPWACAWGTWTSTASTQEGTAVYVGSEGDTSPVDLGAAGPVLCVEGSVRIGSYCSAPSTEERARTRLGCRPRACATTGWAFWCRPVRPSACLVAARAPTDQASRLATMRLRRGRRPSLSSSARTAKAPGR